MNTRTVMALLLVFALLSTAFGQNNERQQFIRAEAAVIVLQHVRVIDGTGAAPLEDQAIVISGGKIAAIGSLAAITIPAGSKTLDLSGYTVMPGFVGMHDHLFFPMGGNPPIYSDMGISFPRLYLALGVTTIRTTGSVAPYTDLEIKRRIDSGQMIGPKIDVTAPYLEGKGAYTPVMHELTGPDDARRMVNFWADEGATSFKAYMNITRDELRAAVEEAHKRGMKVTGHLCSVGYKEAAEIGIDDLEHGIFPDSEFVPNKQPDICPAGGAVNQTLATLDINGPAVQETIRTLVARNVALTSTLPVFEASGPNRPPFDTTGAPPGPVPTRSPRRKERAPICAGRRRSTGRARCHLAAGAVAWIGRPARRMHHRHGTRPFPPRRCRQFHRGRRWRRY